MKIRDVWTLPNIKAEKCYFSLNVFSFFFYSKRIHLFYVFLLFFFLKSGRKKVLKELQSWKTYKQETVLFFFFFYLLIFFHKVKRRGGGKERKLFGECLASKLPFKWLSIVAVMCCSFGYTLKMSTIWLMKAVSG